MRSAQLKPPLFHMHAMSALFHIPQSDPPLLEDGDWYAGCAWRDGVVLIRLGPMRFTNFFRIVSSKILKSAGLRSS